MNTLLQRYKKLLLLGIALAGFGGYVGGAAAGRCFFTSNNIAQAYYNFEGDLQDVAITVGANVPAGTVLHTQKIQIPLLSGGDIDCMGNNPGKLTWSAFPSVIVSTPLPGLDVRLHVKRRNGVEAMPTDVITVNSVQDIKDYVDGLNIYVEVVATGATLSPGVLEYSFGEYSVWLNGNSMLINSPGGERLTLNMASCNTPPLRSYSLGSQPAKAFKQMGDVTPWQDTPVSLTGCKPFGGSGGTSERNVYNITGSLSHVGEGALNDYTDDLTDPRSGVNLNLARNKVSMKLTANTTLVNASQGIMTVTGTSPATGVGLQLGIKDSSGNYQPVDLNTPVEISPPLGDTSGTVTFPLAARYIQTGSRVTGGDANAQLTYTIDYQ